MCIYLDQDHSYKNLSKCAFKSGKLVYSYNHNTQETENGQEFKAILGYTASLKSD